MNNLFKIETPKTLNGTTFEAAPVMEFNTNQTIVPSVVTFGLRVIQTGFFYS